MRFKFFGLVACLLLLGALPSRATTVYVTYAGTVGNGIDEQSATDTRGWFGPAGSSLMGARYETTFVFDVTFGPDNINVSSPTLNAILGGSNYGNVSPSLGATLTIGGHSFSLGGDFIGNIAAENRGGNRGLSQVAHMAHDGTFSLWQTIFNFEGSYSGLPVLIDAAFTYALMPGDVSLGSIIQSGPNGGYLFLQPDRLTLSLAAPSEVLLPAALPLFATGIGGLGLLGWWRRRRKAHAGIATRITPARRAPRPAAPTARLRHA